MSLKSLRMFNRHIRGHDLMEYWHFSHCNLCRAIIAYKIHFLKILTTKFLIGLGYKFLKVHQFKTLEKEITVQQRTFLWICLRVTKSDSISNKELYRRTKTIPCSKTIKERKHHFLGQLLQLPSETQAKVHLQNNSNPHKETLED